MNMQYFEIPYVNKKVSRIFYGTAIAPFNIGEDGNAILDGIYAQGVTAFDTARVYGESEASLGKWIEEREMAEKVVILSKCGHPKLETWRKRINEKEMWEDLKVSLDKLRTDYIDIYLLHRDDPDTEVGMVVEIFNDMHEKGKIGAFGGSNWTHQRIEEANEYAYKHDMIPFSVSSPNYGLADQLCDVWNGGSVSIAGHGNAEAREWYRKTQIPVIAYSSLAHGFFSGKLKTEHLEQAEQILDSYAMSGYCSDENFERLRRCEKLAKEKRSSVSQIAMAWMFYHGLNVAAIVSTANVSRMKQNIGIFDIELSQKEVDWLDLK